MPIQYLYPSTYHDCGTNYNWYTDGVGVQKPSGTLSTEIDEGFSTVNYSDFLGSDIIFNAGSDTNNILTTSVSRNYIVPSSMICSVSCSSVFQNFRSLATYYSGKVITVNVKNKDNGELVAFGGANLGSGLLNLNIPLNIVSRQICPVDYIVDLSFGNSTFPVDFNDYFIPKVYAYELQVSGTIQSKESGVPLNIIGGLNLENAQRIKAYDDNSESAYNYLTDKDWSSVAGAFSSFTNYSEGYHRNDISGHFNTTYFQLNEGSGNVVFSGTKSGRIYSEDNQYRWLTDGTITEPFSLIENRNTYVTAPMVVVSGQLVNNDLRTLTQGNGLYLGPTRFISFSDPNINYQTESFDRLQGIDFYNPLTNSGNFSVYLNMGYNRLREITSDNGTVTYQDDGCYLLNNSSFSVTIDEGTINVQKKSNLQTLNWPLTSNKIDSLILTYNSGLVTGYILYPDVRTWEVQSGTLTDINCFGKLQVGRQEEIYGNYHNVTLHQLGVSDYAFTRTEVDSILDKICAPVNNVILTGAHSVPTYNSGDMWVGVSYQKSVKNSNEKQHFLTNRIVFDDHQLYSIPQSGYVFMDAYVAYTGNHPSGYLGITANSKIDGNNINPLWNTSFDNFQHKVFKSGGIQRVRVVDTWKDTNPYPFGIGANTPEIDIWVTTPASTSYYNGGEFRLYGLEFYTDSAFYVEPTGVAGSITLYTYGSIPNSGSLDLFCGQDERFDSLNLFVKANEPVSMNNSIPLTIFSDSGSKTNSCNLFVKNLAESSGNLPLFIYSDYSPPIASSGSLNLFLNGGYYPSGSVSLFVKNDTKTSTKGINLFVHSSIESSGQLPLNITGGGVDTRSGTLPLTVYSTTPTNSNITLFTQSAQSYSSLPFYIEGKSGLMAADSVDLTIYSTTNSGIFASVPLTLMSDKYDGQMNLFIKNDDSSSDVGSLNLFINSESDSNNFCTLFACNTNGTVNSGVNFYVKGAGINDGAFVGTGSLNLFINRVNESISNSVYFNILGPSGTINNVPLTITGGNIVNNSVTLTIPSTVEIPSGYVPFYSHGF